MKTYRTFCACFVALACASFANANNDTWKIATSGFWSTGTNWLDNSAPGGGDQATFDKAGTYTVTFSTPPTAIQDFFVSSGNVTITTSSGINGALNVNSASGGQDVLVSGSTLTVTTPADGWATSLNAGDDLHVQLGGILNVNAAAAVTTADLFDNFSGTIDVSGSILVGTFPLLFTYYSTLNASNSALVGGIGGTSSLTYRNSARGSLAPAGLVTVGSDGAGILNIDTKAGVEVGSLSVGTSSAAGTINVNSLGTTLGQVGNDTITVGAASGGVGAINIGTAISGGTFTTGTGLMTVNATGSVNIGSVSTSGTFNSNGDILVNGGALRVIGSGSVFTQNGATNVTVSGTGTINVGATASGGTFNTGTGVTTINSSGVVNVGSATTSGTYNANGNILISGGTINVNGAGSMLTQSGAQTITVGGVGTINVGTTASGGAFSTGTGLTTINASGVVNVGSASTSGTFTANGDLTLGGIINIRGGSTVNLQTLTASGGTISLISGSLSYIGNLTIGSGGIFGNGDVSFGNNQQVTLTGTTTVDPARTLTIAGGPVFTTGVLQVNNSGIARIGSGAVGGTLHSNSVGINGGQLIVGTNGVVVGGPLSIAGGGSASFAGASNLVGTTVTDGGSLLNLQSTSDALDSGATWNLTSGGGLSLGGDFHLNSGTISVDGAGSTMTMAAAKTLRIGDVVGATTGVTNVTNDGSLTVGAGGTMLLTNHGTLNINGGSADLKTLNNSGGTINFTAGSLSYLGHLTVGTGGLLGSNLILNADRQLTLSGTTTVDASRTLTLSGGTLTTGGLVVNGAFNFIAGTLAITQTGASVNTPIVAGTSSTINVNANNVSLGLASSFTGFNYGGALNVSANSVTLNSATYARLGAITTLAGGTISAPNGIALATGSNLLGHGAVTARTAAELGSVIEADGALALGDAASPAGYVSNGELRTKQFAVTLNSSAQAALGNLTTLGSGANPGTLNATNGIVVDFGHSLTGFGTVNSSNTLAKRTIINGVAQGNSIAQPLTFSGYVKGVGTFNNVNFTGTFDPGLSPTLLTAGNLAFSPASLLNIELGGLARGSNYDVIQASGQLSFAGTLQISLIDGFNPSAGNSFDILDWGNLSGTFSTLNLPTLPANLMWNASQLYAAGVLSVNLAGDYNGNGIVDAADYVVWRKGLGTAYTQSDYDVWRAHFGQTAGSGAGAIANVAVPEPATMVPLLARMIALFTCRRAWVS